MNVQETVTTTAARSPVRQLSVFLENRVGAMMALIKMLHENHLEVLGMALQEAAELTILRMVLNDPESAQALFAEKGIPHTETQVIVVELQRGAHDLCHALSVLLSAEINVRSCYPLLNRPHLGSLLALHLDDAEVGAEALHIAGFKVLPQDGLSR
jgi:hypothetical protein